MTKARSTFIILKERITRNDQFANNDGGQEGKNSFQKVVEVEKIKSRRRG